LIHLDNLGSLQECLSKQPEFKGMKIFLNLFQSIATTHRFLGLQNRRPVLKRAVLQVWRFDLISDGPMLLAPSISGLFRWRTV
jgi:hypothetical protein